VNAAGPSPFSLTVLEDDGRVVVTLTGELDLATAPEAEAALLPAVNAGRHVVVDLRSLDFIDSTGVRVLVAAHRAADEGPGRLSLRRVDPESPVSRVLEISGLDGILDIIDEG
jgi:stage II sporulation protein AA (anti-sigma F factor antagonist)